MKSVHQITFNFFTISKTVKMKNVTRVILSTILFTLLLSSCSKESKQDDLNNQLTDIQSKLINSYQIAKTSDDSLIVHVNSNGEYIYPGTMMEDSLYHLNDSLCNLYYNTYCDLMESGDDMMGSGMMGGNGMHGSGMMSGHSYSADTAASNQIYRKLIHMRNGHSAHHPN